MPKNIGYEYLEKILLANVYNAAVQTPLNEAPDLSKKLNNRIFLKREDLQPVFSFKIRGAYNKMANLTSEQLEKGVVTASAGNHAQGVAMSAKILKCQAIIVMPITTPAIKVNAVKSLGATVVLHGESYDDAKNHAASLAKNSGASYIHAFDDPLVIAGQGTIGMEIMRQAPAQIDYVFVQIGGGGLAAGVAAYIKSLRPEIKVIGVEPTGANAMELSMQNGELVSLDSVDLFADGVAVKEPGSETFRLCKALLDDIISVDIDAMCNGIKDIFESTRVVTEPSGALALAGARAYILKHDIQDKNIVAIVSGANMNFERLRSVAERAEVGGQREAILAVTIPEEIGTFKKFSDTLKNRKITELSTRIADPVSAQVLLSVGLDSTNELDEIISDLRNDGFEAYDFTDNELAKTHLRYLVGGNAPLIKREKLIHFVFPERQGALYDFMNSMQIQWTLTLFHYRYTGTDHGKVLLGLQVPETDEQAFNEFLKNSIYDYTDETNNPAYTRFLGWHLNLY